MWAGGRCQPHPCDADVLHRSPTTCYGYTSDECDYACDPGYHTSGAHVCRSDGLFAGGACLPNSCAPVAVPHALTTCTGATADVCDFECGPATWQQALSPAKRPVCLKEGNVSNSMPVRQKRTTAIKTHCAAPRVLASTIARAEARPLVMVIRAQRGPHACQGARGLRSGV